MFYCDWCRAAREWPKAIGWPGMGTSQGKCELCSNVDICHDVPSTVLSRYKNQRQLKIHDCGECGKQRYGWKNDYICVFCRGDVLPPDIAEDIRKYEERIAEIGKRYRLGNLSPETLDTMVRNGYSPSHGDHREEDLHRGRS